MNLILDDPPPPRNNRPGPGSASTISLSPFPPRPPLSDVQPYPYYAQTQQGHAQEPLLPFALRHPIPTSLSTSISPPPFQQPLYYPPGASSTFNGGAHFVTGRGRYKIALIAGGAALLFLLHAHFYRPRGHRPPPPWAFQQLRQPPREGGFSELESAPRPPQRWEHGAPPHAPPPPPEDPANRPAKLATAIVLPKMEEAAFQILPEEDFIQKRREVPPSWPDPWVGVKDRKWQGRDWLDPHRFEFEHEGGKELGSTEWEEAHKPPPARFLMRAYRFMSLNVQKFMAVSKSRIAPGTGWNDVTGRPLVVQRSSLFLNPKDWKEPTIKVADLERGVGVKELEKVQWQGEWDLRKEKVDEEKQRREWVKRAFLHVWDGYKRHAWGHDELKPISNSSSDPYNGWGASIVDNLDTLLIMGLSGEYNLAREHVASIDWTYLVPGKVPFSTEFPEEENMIIPGDEDETREAVADDGPQGTDEPEDDNEDQENKKQKKEKRDWTYLPDWKSPGSIPVFETTIRYLGGLLSAYDLSGDPLMLERATELGDWILPALGTKEGLALGRLVLGSNPNGLPSGRVVLSEAGSLSMEFTRLSMLTGDEIYYRAIQRSTDRLETGFDPAAPVSKDPHTSPRGRLGTLLPAHLDPGHPHTLSGEYTFGGLADSYYEYLIKEYQLLGGAVGQYEKMYTEAIDSAYQYLIERVGVVPGREDLSIIGFRAWGLYSPRLEHLTCFAGGMLGLGAKLLDRPHDMNTAVNVTEGCVWAYESSATGVGPESIVFYGEKDSARYSVVDAPDGVSKARKPRGNPVGVKTSNPRQIGRPETIESVMYMYRLTGDRKWQDKGWIMFVDWVQSSIVSSGFATILNVNINVKDNKADSMESFVMAETLKYYYLLFSPPDFISLDDYVFNTEAHPFKIPKPTPSPPLRLWTGPSRSSGSNSFAPSNTGEGTWVQLWSRVQQCNALARPLGKTSSGVSGGGFGVGGGGARERVRPTKEELAKAKEDQAEAREISRKAREEAAKNAKGSVKVKGRPGV